MFLFTLGSSQAIHKARNDTNWCVTQVVTNPLNVGEVAMSHPSGNYTWYRILNHHLLPPISTPFKPTFTAPPISCTKTPENNPPLPNHTPKTYLILYKTPTKPHPPLDKSPLIQITRVYPPSPHIPPYLSARKGVYTKLPVNSISIRRP